jgi:hypothetical protein
MGAAAARWRHVQATVGVVGYGIGAFAYLVAVGRILGPARFPNVSLLWTAVFTGVVGLLVPVEQEGARAIGMAVATGADIADAAREVRGSASVVAGTTAVAAVVASPLLARELFDGQLGFVAVLAASIVAYGLVHAARAVLVGTGSLGRFSALLLVDTGARLALTAILYLAGARSGLVLALAVPASPVLALLVVAPRALAFGGAAGGWARLVRRIGPIIVAALVAQLVLNFPALAVRALAPDDQAAAVGSFLASLSLARSPLMLFGAFEAAMVPTLTAHAAHERLVDLRRVMRRYVAAVAAIAAGCTVAGALGLRLALRLGFGEAFTFRLLSVVLVLVGTGGCLVTFVLGQGLLTLGRRRLLVAPWLASLVVEVLVMATGWDTLTVRASAAFAAGPAVGAVVGLVVLEAAIDGAAAVTP